MIDDLYNLGFFNGTIWDIFFIVLFIVLTRFLVLKNVIPYFKNQRWIQFVISLLISVFFLLITIFISINYIMLQKDYSEWCEVFKDEAKEEIEKDLIDWEYYGLSFGMVITGSPKVIDSISKSYGVNLIAPRDILYSSHVENGRVKYYENPRKNYLDKRNGVGWEKRMDEALRPYIIDLMKK